MEIAPDFFDYFEATATLLEKDKYASGNSPLVYLISFGTSYSTKFLEL